MSASEFLLWVAYYSLEPYSNEVKHLIYLEAATRELKDPRSIFPPECKLDQPLDIKEVQKSKANLADQLNAMVAEYIPQVRDLLVSQGKL